MLHYLNFVLYSHNEMMITKFVTLALLEERNSKLNVKEEINTDNMRTLSFHVSEGLFNKIKYYLWRNNMTQKQFAIGFIES